jgi:kynureninase
MTQQPRDGSSDPFSKSYAASLDASDPLSHFRTNFHIPTQADLKRPTLAQPPDEEPSQPCTYLCGNSLGLQPVRTAEFINAFLTQWRTKAVMGHFVDHDDSPLQPFLHIDDHAAKLIAPVVGAVESEVAVMGSLTTNLHILMSSFYRPSKKGEGRWKILLEGKAFPSDHVSEIVGLIVLAPLTSQPVRRGIANRQSRPRSQGCNGAVGA